MVTKNLFLNLSSLVFLFLFFMAGILILSKETSAVEGWPVESPGEERPEGMFNVSEEVVTPHITWAKPYYRGPIDVLFIIPRWTGREVVEIAQRLDIHYEVVMLEGRETLSFVKDDAVRLSYGAERPKQTIKRLQDKLAKDYDVIVLGNIFVKTLPEEIWREILEKVKNGTGLIVTENSLSDTMLKEALQSASPVETPLFFKNLIPYKVLPAFAENNETTFPPMNVFRLDKGLILIMNYKVGIGNQFICPEFTVTEWRKIKNAYDYYQSMVAKLILFAGDKLPEIVRISSVTVNPAVVVRDTSEPMEIVIQTEGVKISLAELRLCIHDITGRKTFQYSKPFLGEKEVRFFLKKGDIPTGQYFADVWVIDSKGKTLDWSSTAFSVIDGQGFAKFSAAEKFILPEGKITALMELKRPLTPREKLSVEVYDFFDRLTFRQAITPGNKSELSLSIPSGKTLSLMMKLRVFIERDGKLVEEQTIEVPVRQPSTGFGWDDFSFMTWAYEGTYIQHFVNKQLMEAGMDRLMSSQGSYEKQISQAPRIASEYNCRSFPYPNVHHVGNILQCDPQPIREAFTGLAQELYPYSCDTFSLGDECQLGFGPYSTWKDNPLDNPVLNKSFQEYLKKIYPSLEVLNAEWNTNFKSWEEINGISLQDAKQGGQEARWVDHRLHRETCFAEAMQAGMESVQKINPENRAGFEGAWQTDSYVGYDWWKLGQSLNLMGSYWFTPAEWEFMGSFKKPGTYWGFWNGAYIDVSNRWTQGWIPWRSLFWGMNGVWYWLPYSPYAISLTTFGIYFPDLRVNPACKPFLDSLAEIKKGIGKLIITSERLNSKIAIHYSQASLHANTLDDGNFKYVGAGVSPSRIQTSWLTFAWSLKEIGFQPWFVSYEEIESGELKNYRILILPFSQAISPKECAEIRNFVNNGGILIADVKPGVRDGHGKLQNKGLLDELFGIERIGNVKPEEPGNIGVDFTLGKRRINGKIALAQPDPAVRLKGGQALAYAGGTPFFIVNNVGKGKAVLLNFAGNYSPGSYDDLVVPQIRTTAPGDIYREIAQSLVELAGIKPEIEVKTGNESLRGIDIVTWKDGDASYYGLTPNDYCDYAWVLTMPKVMYLEGKFSEPGHIYNVREGKYLGYGNNFKTKLERGSATLLAKLPYKVRALKVRGHQKLSLGKTGEFYIEVIPGAKEKPGNHVFRVEIMANGKLLSHYSSNIKVGDGNATYSLPLALNDVKGNWVVKVRDVATGTTGYFKFRVI